MKAYISKKLGRRYIGFETDRECIENVIKPRLDKLHTSIQSTYLNHI